MRMFIVVVLSCVLSGCVTDVSQESPHNRLIGTVWKLKTDAYILANEDQRGELRITPKTKNFSVYFDSSIFDAPYDKNNIGRKKNGVKIVGGLRAGEAFEVVRVLKVPHIKLGTSYIPVMIPEKTNKWTGGKVLDGKYLYYGRDKNGKFFDEQGILNPEYAEIVTVVTNPPPRGAEAGGGSESSNP